MGFLDKNFCLVLGFYNLEQVLDSELADAYGFEAGFGYQLQYGLSGLFLNSWLSFVEGLEFGINYGIIPYSNDPSCRCIAILASCDRSILSLNLNVVLIAILASCDRSILASCDRSIGSPERSLKR